jgi:hypothetical protein
MVLVWCQYGVSMVFVWCEDVVGMVFGWCSIAAVPRCVDGRSGPAVGVYICVCLCLLSVRAATGK